MKIKIIATLSLSGLMFLSACGGGAANNANNTNANANKPANTSTPTVSNMSSGNDAQVKAKIEENLKAKGCTGATADVASGVATVRGTVPKGKLAECVMAVNDAKPGKVENQMTEAK